MSAICRKVVFAVVLLLAMGRIAAAAEVCVVDTGGPNDQSGQKQNDLSQQCVDFANVAVNGTYDASINWDEISFNNSADACLLFDTDFDGFINFSVCVSVKNVAGVPTLINGPILANCDDTSLDQCTGETIIPIVGVTSCALTIEPTDPFPGPPASAQGDSYPNDTVATCTVDVVDIPVGSLQVNNCSYASPSATSAPKDCSLGIVDADLSVTKTDGQSTYPAPPSIVTYTIVVTNNGPDDVPAANVADYQPSGTTATWTCSADPGSSCLNAAGTGDLIDYPSIEAGDSVTYTMNVALPAGFTGDLFNRASAVGTSDSNTSNNTATDTDLEPGDIDLTIVKTVDDAEPVPGQTVTFTLTVSNAAGFDDATSVNVVDVIPAGFTYVSGSIAGGDTRDDSSPTGSGLQWTINTLPSGGSAATLTFTATVNPS